VFTVLRISALKIFTFTVLRRKCAGKREGTNEISITVLGNEIKLQHCSSVNINVVESYSDKPRGFFDTSLYNPMATHRTIEEQDICKSGIRNQLP
jgi:hypothetical protein